MLHEDRQGILPDADDPAHVFLPCRLVVLWYLQMAFQPNDADRLKKYLARFGLSWDALQA
jgi:hypothetical protein